jgi:transposase
MAWTELTRTKHNRKTDGYQSDLTDEEWTVVHPFLPGRNRLGRPRQVDLRKIWNAIQYIAASGCAWSLLPKDFPPVSTVRYYFYRWRDDGLLAEINRALVAAVRLAAGRDVQPSAGVIDSQSVKTSENTSLSGFDAGKRIKGRKRHIITDTCGHLLACTVHSAGIQDRDGAPRVFAKLRREAPNLRHMFADGGYAGPKLRDALVGLGRWTLQIVKRSDTPNGFEVLPRRWVIERTFAWLGRCRRLTRDWEKSIESAEAWVLIAHIRRMTRLLAKP